MKMHTINLQTDELVYTIGSLKMSIKKYKDAIKEMEQKEGFKGFGLDKPWTQAIEAMECSLRTMEEVLEKSKK